MEKPKYKNYFKINIKGFDLIYFHMSFVTFIFVRKPHLSFGLIESPLYH